jgi:hypothetical protein
VKKVIKGSEDWESKIITTIFDIYKRKVPKQSPILEYDYNTYLNFSPDLKYLIYYKFDTLNKESKTLDEVTIRKTSDKNVYKRIPDEMVKIMFKERWNDEIERNSSNLHHVISLMEETQFVRFIENNSIGLLMTDDTEKIIDFEELKEKNICRYASVLS